MSLHPVSGTGAALPVLSQLVILDHLKQEMNRLFKNIALQDYAPGVSGAHGEAAVDLSNRVLFKDLQQTPAGYDLKLQVNLKGLPALQGANADLVAQALLISILKRLDNIGEDLFEPNGYVLTGKHIDSLDLSNTKVTGNSVTNSAIFLSCCVDDFYDDLLATFGDIQQHLTEVNLSNTQADTILQELAVLPELVTLRLDGCQGLDNAAAANYPASLTKITIANSNLPADFVTTHFPKLNSKAAQGQAQLKTAAQTSKLAPAPSAASQPRPLAAKASPPAAATASSSLPKPVLAKAPAQLLAGAVPLPVPAAPKATVKAPAPTAPTTTTTSSAPMAPAPQTTLTSLAQALPPPASGGVADDSLYINQPCSHIFSYEELKGIAGRDINPLSRADLYNLFCTYCLGEGEATYLNVSRFS